MGFLIKLRKLLGQGDVDPIDDMSPVNRAVAQTARDERASADQARERSRVEWEQRQAEEQARLEAEKQEANEADRGSITHFMPIIRSFTEGEVFEQNMMYYKMGENIGAFAAAVGIGQHGQPTIMYMTRNTLGSLDMTEEDMAAACLRNIVNARLDIDGMTDGVTGDMMITVMSAIGLATSLLFDTEFMDTLNSEFGDVRMHVTIINSNTVFLTAPGSSFEAKFEEIVREDKSPSVIHMDPATYTWSGHQLLLVKKYRN